MLRGAGVRGMRRENRLRGGACNASMGMVLSGGMGLGAGTRGPPGDGCAGSRVLTVGIDQPGVDPPDQLGEALRVHRRLVVSGRERVDAVRRLVGPPGPPGDVALPVHDGRDRAVPGLVGERDDPAVRALWPDDHDTRRWRVGRPAVDRLAALERETRGASGASASPPSSHGKAAPAGAATARSASRRKSR